MLGPKEFVYILALKELAQRVFTYPATLTPLQVCKRPARFGKLRSAAGGEVLTTTGFSGEASLRVSFELFQLVKDDST